MHVARRMVKPKHQPTTGLAECLRITLGPRDHSQGIAALRQLERLVGECIEAVGEDQTGATGSGASTRLR